VLTQRVWRWADLVKVAADLCVPVSSAGRQNWASPCGPAGASCGGVHGDATTATTERKYDVPVVDDKCGEQEQGEAPADPAPLRRGARRPYAEEATVCQGEKR
jgi:hypothetical protein